MYIWLNLIFFKPVSINPKQKCVRAWTTLKNEQLVGSCNIVANGIEQYFTAHIAHTCQQ